MRGTVRAARARPFPDKDEIDAGGDQKERQDVAGADDAAVEDQEFEERREGDEGSGRSLHHPAARLPCRLLVFLAAEDVEPCAGEEGKQRPRIGP